MTAAALPQLEVRLRSSQALRDAMQFARLNVRELAVACGKPSYRSTIGHLHSGARNRCSPHLAARIEHVLRLPAHSLFELSISSTHHVDSGRQTIRRAA
jgi:hypothetical protein